MGGLVVLLACDRTGEGEQEQETTQTPSTSQLPGFALGQVATVQEPPAQVPIGSIDPVELGRSFRGAVRELWMFGEEGAPGPVLVRCLPLFKYPFDHQVGDILIAIPQDIL